MKSSFLLPRFTIQVFGILALLIAPCVVHAQANFDFWVGLSGVSGDNGPVQIGVSDGASLKFNIDPLLRIRGQINVDKAQLHDVVSGEFHGGQTLTAINFGFGLEAAVGGRDINVFASVTPHITIRSLFRISKASDSTEPVSGLTRFSIGAVGAVGVEAYITDNIGFELQGQYDILNFDHNEVDPRYTVMRAMAGVQFYLGRNFVR